jgi:hypothetical protein
MLWRARLAPTPSPPSPPSHRVGAGGEGGGGGLLMGRVLPGNSEQGPANLFDLGGGWVALPLVIGSVSLVSSHSLFSLLLTPSLSLLHSA